VKAGRGWVRAQTDLSECSADISAPSREDRDHRLLASSDALSSLHHRYESAGLRTAHSRSYRVVVSTKQGLERETGIEPATCSLEGCTSQWRTKLPCRSVTRAVA